MQLLDFWSPRCGPCKAIEKYLDEFEADNQGIVEVVNLNTKEPQNRQLVSAFGVRGTPTLILVKDGQEVARAVGSRVINSTHALKNWVRMYEPRVR